MTHRILLIAALLLLAALPGTATAGWNELVGGPSPINASRTSSAGVLRIENVEGRPHVLGVERGGPDGDTLLLSRLSLSGDAWEQVGPPISSRPGRMDTE